MAHSIYAFSHFFAAVVYSILGGIIPEEFHATLRTLFEMNTTTPEAQILEIAIINKDGTRTSKR